MPGASLQSATATEPGEFRSGREFAAWLGLVPREQLYAEVYPRADLFLYPTHFDCAPLVVQEALANSLPVVAPRILGLPDLVRLRTAPAW